MADDYEKLWLQSSLNALAATRALEAIQATGRTLPCRVTAVDGSIVTVAFEVTGPWTLPLLTLPKAEGQWLRSSTQVGDFGITMPADTYLGYVSGTGAGVADLVVDYGNMSTLVWVPIGSTKFAVAPDPNKIWANGPAGAVVSDTAQTATMTASPNNITHIAGVGTANEVKTIYDGAGNAISHVVSSGGLIGLGALASSLTSERAVSAKDDLDELANGGEGIVNQSMVKHMAAVGAAIGSASGSWSTAQAELEAIFAAADFIPNISGILPTIPSCSSIVRVSP